MTSDLGDSASSATPRSVTWQFHHKISNATVDIRNLSTTARITKIASFHTGTMYSMTDRRSIFVPLIVDLP